MRPYQSLWRGCPCDLVLLMLDGQPDAPHYSAPLLLSGTCVGYTGSIQPCPAETTVGEAALHYAGKRGKSICIKSICRVTLHRVKQSSTDSSISPHITCCILQAMTARA
jgi:hypothetical protein